MKGKKELHPSSTKNFRTPAILFWLAVSFPLFVCLSVCLIVCQSVCIYLFVCCQSVSLPLSVYLFFPLSVSLSLLLLLFILHSKFPRHTHYNRNTPREHSTPQQPHLHFLCLSAHPMLLAVCPHIRKGTPSECALLGPSG